MNKPKAKAGGSVIAGAGMMSAVEDTHLRCLTDQEAGDCFVAAQANKRVHEPTWLRSRWGQRQEDAKPQGVAELVRIMRAFLDTSRLDDLENAPQRLARLVHIIVTRFERLVIGGVMDGILPRLNSLPVLYSPTAGSGASKWTWAHELFQAKQVGRDGKYPHGRCDTSGDRTLQWRHIAEEAVDVAFIMSLRLPEFDELRHRAVAQWPFAFKRHRARYGLFGTFYLLDDESVLVWPAWLDKCRGLPWQVSADIQGYKDACRALAQEFFGDRYNTYSATLLKTLLRKGRERQEADGRAYMVAADKIAAAVGRMGGEK